MADGDGQSVGGVVGPGDLLHAQQPLGHEHHLPLVRAPVAHHRLLHLHGGVLEDGDPQFFRRQEDNPPAVGHGDAGGDVFGEEELLHRHLVRVKGADQLLHVVGDLQKPVGQGDARRGGDHPVLDQGILLPLRPDDPKADGGHPGVDAQYDHADLPASLCTQEISLLYHTFPGLGSLGNASDLW